MASRFIPRSHFPYDRVINWFPGHMAKGLRLISEKMNSIDLFVEVRDARIPLSSVNPNFEKLIGRKPRLIVYNKCDLADPVSKEPILSAYARQSPNTPVVFTSCQTEQNLRDILKYAASLANPVPYITLMIVGMPNVGKSSLINALRRVGVGRGKAVQTGAQPGVTRTVANTVKVLEEPTVYVVDSPGVMVPYIADASKSLKVALAGGMRDHLADEYIMADYLLYRLNQFEAYDYAKNFRLPQGEPTNDIQELLQYASRRIGAIRKGGTLDDTAAARFFIQQYRDGKLGRFTLDDVSPEALDTFFSDMKRQLDPSLQNKTKSRRRVNKLAKLEQRKQERERIRNGPSME